MLNHDVITKV
jgi:hypothetical protein